MTKHRLAWAASAAFGLALAATSATPASAQFTPGALYVVRVTTGSQQVISEVNKTSGAIVRDFGADAPGVIGHLAHSGGLLFRADNSPVIDVFDSSGTLVHAIQPATSPTPNVLHVARDFSNSLVMFADTFAGVNVLHKLNDTSGGYSTVTTFSLSGDGGIQGAAFGGPAGNEAFYSLEARNPTFGWYAVAKYDGVSTSYWESADLVVPYVADIGDLDVDPNDGSVHVVTSTQVVSFDASGTQTGIFAHADGSPTITISPDSELFIGNRDNGSISVYTEAGTLLRTLTLANTSQVVEVYFIPGGAPSAPILSVSPSSAQAFSPTLVNQTSGAKTVTISNTGTASMTVSSIGKVGGDTGQFTVQLGTCPSLAPTIAAGSSCTVLVSFVPTSLTPSSKSTTLRIVSNAGNVDVPFSGITGTATTIPTLSEWGAILMGSLLALTMFFAMRRRDELQG